MISYERIDKSESIDFNKSQKSKECMICHYFYFSDGFKYQPYVCDFFIVTMKNVDYRVYIVGADKKAAIYLLNNSVLEDESGF